MAERKLVKSGLSSFTIALPKDWIDRNNLNKGSVVYCDEENNRLILMPKKAKTKKKNAENVFDVDNAETPLTIVWDVVSSYLTNSGDIRLIGKTLRQKMPIIRRATAQLVGLEVMEETSNSILFKDFINIDDIIIPHLVRRSDIILRSMFLDTASCLQLPDAELAEAIRLRDKEVNRLSFLMSKALNYLADHPHQAHSHGIAARNFMHCWELNMHLEKIGDEIKRLAMVIPNSQLQRHDQESIRLLLHDVQDFYLNSMNALHKHDIKLADRAAGNRENLIEKCDEYLNKTKSLYARQAIARLKYIVYNINDITRLVRYLSFIEIKVKED